jgi:hypothetical protein
MIHGRNTEVHAFASQRFSTKATVTNSFKGCYAVA